MLDADQSQLAAEIARRSRPELGSDGLAKTQGYRNPTALIAATGGTSTGDAARLVKVGEATARELLSGQKAPARHPHVAAALAAAALTERAAGAIIALLDRVAFRAGPEALDVAERTLVEQAPGLTHGPAEPGPGPGGSVAGPGRGRTPRGARSAGWSS